MKRGFACWVAALAATIALHSERAEAQYFINEIFFNVGGAGDDLREEYIELRGPASASLDNTYLLILENELPGGLGDKAGVVERIFDLNTRTMGSNGFLTLRQKNSRYVVAPGTTDLINEGTEAGYGNGPGSSTIRALSNGSLDLEGGGFTAMLIHNATGAAPTLNLDLDFEVDNDNNPLTEKDGLDYPGMGRPGWSILDSVGIFAEPEETETGRLYGQVNYARFDQFIDPNFVPAIEPGTAFQKINFEIEYMGRWGNSTGHDVGDWHISNFTDKVNAGSAGVSAVGGPDWRQSCVDVAGCHPANDNNPATPAPQPPGGTESSQAVPYGTKLTNTLGAPNFIPGDFNKDGDVNTADYTVWRDSLGQTGTETNHPAADPNHDFVVNDLDYNIWKANFGAPSNTGGGGLLAGATSGKSAVPEPATWLLCGLGLAIYAAKTRRR